MNNNGEEGTGRNVKEMKKGAKSYTWEDVKYGAIDIKN